MIYDEAELGVIVTTVRICLAATVLCGNILKVLSSVISESISSINLILSENVIHNVNMVREDRRMRSLATVDGRCGTFR